MRRLISFVLTTALWAIPALATPPVVGPVMLQNYGADLDNPALFWTNIGGGAVGKLGVGTGLTPGGGNLNVNIGTAGATIPLMSGANTWSGFQNLAGGASLSAGATTVPIRASFFNIIAPESQATIGAGSTASPFTSVDGTAGVGAAITALGANGGQIPFGGAAYSMTAGVTIAQPGVALKCASRGFNIDPDGLTQGNFGCRVTVPAAAAGFTIGSASRRIQGFTSDDVYVYGAGSVTDGSAGYKFSGAGGGTDTAQFHRGLISNVQYGIYGGAAMDAPMLTNTMFLGVGYPIYLPSGGGGAIWAQFLGLGMADNANSGIFDASTAGGTQTIGGVFVRNAFTLTTHGSNYYTTGAGAGLIGAVLDQPGLNFLTSGQVAADNVILDGQFNRVVGNWINRTPSGSNVHLTGSALYNIIALNVFGASSGSSVLLDNGSQENAIYSPVPITITDNSAHNNYLDYIVQAGGPNVNGRIIQNAATVNTTFKVNSTGLYGAYIGLDATALTGGHLYTFGSTAGAAADGQGLFAITDQTVSGTDRLTINAAGTVTIPGYAQVKSGFIVGPSAALTLSVGEIGLNRIAASGSAPGAVGLKLATVCGTGAGSAKIIAYAGTSTTPVTVADNIGAGVTGC